MEGAGPSGKNAEAAGEWQKSADFRWLPDVSDNIIIAFEFCFVHGRFCRIGKKVDGPAKPC